MTMKYIKEEYDSDDGEHIQRLYIPEIDVQIVRIDYDDNNILVKVREHVAMMRMVMVNMFIRNWL